MKKRIGFGLIASLALAIIIFSIIPASAEDKSLTSWIEAGSGSPRSAENYWTPELMVAAQPYPIPEVTKGQKARLTAADTRTSNRGVGMTPGHLPEVEVEGPGVQLIPLEMLPAEETAGREVGYNKNAGPYTRYENFDTQLVSGNTVYAKYPYTTIGKLFFTQYGSNYVCSGSVISQYAVITAGHCAHAGDNSSSGWSYNISFVPGYRNGYSPFSSAPFTSVHNIWVLTPWYQKGMGRLDSDVAIIVFNTNIGDTTGWLGTYWNLSPTQAWVSAGYPAASPFNGQVQQLNHASFAYKYKPKGSKTATIGMGNDLTGGCSGGPWILGFSGSSGSTNWVNGVNSYRRTKYPREMFSPYFNTNVGNLITTGLGDTP